MKKLIFYSLVILIFSSCKRVGHGAVDGTVYEVGTNSPVQGVKVYLMTYRRNLHQTHSFTVIDSTVSDSQGHYLMYLRKKIGVYYVVYCRTNTHFRSYPNADYEFTNKNTTRDFYLYPFSYLRVKVKKSSIGILKYAAISIPNLELDRVYSLNQLDTTLPTIYKLRGNGENWIVWSSCVKYYYNDSCVGNQEALYPAKGDTITKTFVID